VPFYASGSRLLSGRSICLFHFLNAVEEGVVEGKLQCVKCEARLGNFNWSGMQCSCGAWVTPAFQLHKSRMDAAQFWTSVAQVLSLARLSSATRVPFDSKTHLDRRTFRTRVNFYVGDCAYTFKSLLLQWKSATNSDGPFSIPLSILMFILSRLSCLRSHFSGLVHCIELTATDNDLMLAK